MSFKSFFLTSAALMCLCAVPTSAKAGQLFPPANSDNTSHLCGRGEVLIWNGSEVDCVPTPSCASGQAVLYTGSAFTCVNPSPAVTVSSCPTGLFSGISNGAATCMSVPQCQAGETLNFNSTANAFQCQALPTCTTGQVLTYNGNAFSCVSTNPSVPTCPAGQFLTYIGGAFQCASTPSISIPSCGANQYVTGNGSQLICANLPATGGGITGGCDVIDNISNATWKTETYAWGQGCQPAGTAITVIDNAYSVGQTASAICAAFEAPGYSCGSVTGPGNEWASCECVAN